MHSACSASANGSGDNPSVHNNLLSSVAKPTPSSPQLTPLEAGHSNEAVCTEPQAKATLEAKPTPLQAKQAFAAPLVAPALATPALATALVTPSGWRKLDPASPCHSEPFSAATLSTACSDDLASGQRLISLDSPAAPSLLPSAKDALLLESVQIRDPQLRPSLTAMLPAIRDLSLQCFDEDVTLIINKKSGWKIHLLVTRDESRLLGFLSYKVREGCLEIAKLAVCDDCRHKGYGRRLVKAVVTDAKRSGNIEFVGLSSLEYAVSFYQKLGFTKHDDVKFAHVQVAENEEIISGQVYMEMHIRQKRSRKKK